jgi:hypothetical protein
MELATPYQVETRLGAARNVGDDDQDADAVVIVALSTDGPACSPLMLRAAIHVRVTHAVHASERRCVQTTLRMGTKGLRSRTRVERFGKGALANGRRR